MPFFKPRIRPRVTARPKLAWPAARSRNTAVFGKGIPKRVRTAERMKLVGSKLAKETLKGVFARGRTKVVQEERRPMREARRLEARLELAMREGN